MFFWNSLAFSMIQHMLAIWSLVPLPFHLDTRDADLRISVNIWWGWRERHTRCYLMCYDFILLFPLDMHLLALKRFRVSRMSNSVNNDQQEKCLKVVSPSTALDVTHWVWSAFRVSGSVPAAEHRVGIQGRCWPEKLVLWADGTVEIMTGSPPGLE